MSEVAEAAFGDAIRTIEQASAVEVVVAVRPRLRRWLVPNVALGAVLAAAALAFTLWSDIEFELWSIFVVTLLAATAGGLGPEVIPALERALTPARERAAILDLTARAAFHELGVHATKGRTGLLVLVAVRERRIALVGDLALVERIGEPGLDRRATALATALPGGGSAVAKALAALAPELAAALPRPTNDVNELADLVNIRAYAPRRFRGRPS